MNVTLSMDSVLNFLHSMSLTASNKRWLAEHLLNEAKAEVREESSPSAYTASMLNKYYGAWVGSETAEDTMLAIREHSSSREPVAL
ncbi:MAG: hypothetical protein J6M53_03930 [Bacteroidaceae bacterium]|nr:hypothetical protein [Bacteroidaceae bacterium]